MAIYFNGTKLEWYEADINVNGTVISSNDDLNDVYHNGIKVHGSSNFASETTLYSFGLAPDSSTFENTHIPTLLNTYGDAIEYSAYQTGAGIRYPLVCQAIQRLPFCNIRWDIFRR